jgi:type II secretory pathway component PulF
MMLSYCALKRDGTTLTDRADFDSIQDLMDTLASQDLTLVSYREKTYPVVDAALNMLQPAVSRMEIVEFSESLASMIGSGLPLLDSMESIKDTIRVKRLREALETVIREVSRGETLSGAFSHHPTVFPEMLVFFCSIGEETGTIQNALNNTAEYLRKVDSILSQVKRAFIYPSFVICAMGCVMIFWLFYVLPRLAETFKDINVQLPEITLTLVHFVTFIQHAWYLIPVGLACLVAASMFLARIEMVRSFCTKVAFKTPVFGDLLKASILTLFFSSLSLMLRSGLTLTKSLDVLVGIFRNPLLKNMIRTIQSETSSGNSLIESFRSTQFFDAVTLKMVSVGEKTGTLDERLRYLANTYQEKTTRFVELSGKMIEPIVMVLSGGLFIFIVISLIGPVYDLMSQLGGG